MSASPEKLAARARADAELEAAFARAGDWPTINELAGEGADHKTKNRLRARLRSAERRGLVIGSQTSEWRFRWVGGAEEGT